MSRSVRFYVYLQRVKIGITLEVFGVVDDQQTQGQCVGTRILRR